MNLNLTPKEKRTIRIAAVCVCVYLALFYGPGAWRSVAARREACDRLMQQARDLRDIIKPYEGKIATATNLMDRFRMDPAKLKRSSVVAEASAAIQQAAMAEKVVVGPVREMAGRPSAKEAGALHIGFPIIIDTIQITSDPRMPNGLKMSLTIVVLDFDAWKPKEEKPHA